MYWGWIVVGCVAALAICDGLMVRSLSQMTNILKWFNERNVVMRPIMEQAYIVRSVPNHSQELVKSGGEVVAVMHGQRTTLNFAMLKEMTFLMLDMESERRVAVNRMAKSLDALAVWEQEHRFPEPKTSLLRLKKKEPVAIESAG